MAYFAIIHFSDSHIKQLDGLEVINLLQYSGSKADSLILQGVINHPAHAELDIHDYTTKKVEVFTHDGEVYFKGFISEIYCNHQQYTMRILSTKAALDKPLTRNFSKTCDAEFCDKRCGLVLSDHSFELDVVSLKGRMLYFQRPAGRIFENGYVIAAHQSYSIVEDHLDYIELDYAPKQAFQKFTIHMGCNKTIEHCNQYGNSINFRGFPFDI